MVWMPGGVRTEIRLDAERTDGALCLLPYIAGWGENGGLDAVSEAAELIEDRRADRERDRPARWRP